MSPPSTPSIAVDVFSSGPPRRPYADVALLEVEQRHGLDAEGTATMIHELRQRAANLGCDGIVLGGFRERGGGPSHTLWWLADPGSTTLHATCIVYPENVGSFAHVSPAANAPERQVATRQRIDFEDPR